MKARRSILMVIVLSLTVTLLACSPVPVELADVAGYSLRLLVVRADSEDYLEPFQHLLNTMHANVTVEPIHIGELQAKHLIGVDAVYPDPSIIDADGWQAEAFTKLMRDYVAGGGHLFLEAPFIDQLPTDLLGVAEWVSVDTREPNFSYPAVSYDYIDMQAVYREFIQGLRQLQVLPREQIIPQRAAELSTALSLVDINGASLLAVNSYEAGTVTWADGLLPNRDYISRLDFVPSNAEQPYFHYGYTTANWLFRSKYLNFVAKQKYGFALEKVLGAYHRPAVAWQNHFEVLSAFARQDIKSFTELLRDYRQVPTFSLIRGTFNWSYWAPSISWLPNIGSDTAPKYQGMLADSFYGTGQRLMKQDGTHLDLGRYQGAASLLGTLQNPARAYPCVADLNGDGRLDLLVGTPAGEVYYFPNQAADGKPVLQQQMALISSTDTVSTAFAAPTVGDLTGDNLHDLVVGNKQGQLLIYHNQGTSTEPKFTLKRRLNLGLGEYTAPYLVDWDEDGLFDLVVGVADGSLYWLPGQPGSDGITFGDPQLILATGLKWAAPCVADWDNDGLLDLLVGSYNGQVALFQQENGNWVRQDNLQGENRNFFGNNNLNIGRNSVPLLVDWEGNGQVGLLLGGVEYGAPYAINDPANPARKGILASVKYLQENHLPILVHAYVHEFKTVDEEREELELHRQAFLDLGIEWDFVGVNHHTWRINENALQTFLVEQEVGISYDFGFHPYKSPGQPRDGKAFMPFVAPFRLTVGEKAEPFLLWAPVPEVRTFAPAYRSMQKFDLPITYFDHVENRLTVGSHQRALLTATVEALGRVQREGNYSFMTEEQVAKSLFNHYYCNLEVTFGENGITLEADVSQVPEQAAEYKGAIGVHFLPGADLASTNLSTDAWLRYRSQDRNDLYVGLLGPTQIVWGEEELPAPQLEILCSNTPINVLANDDDGIELELATKGMQQLVLRSSTPLIIEGEGLLIDKADDVYTITHYGTSCLVKLIQSTDTR